MPDCFGYDTFAEKLRYDDIFPEKNIKEILNS